LAHDTIKDEEVEMRRFQVVSAVVALLLIITASACGSAEALPPGGAAVGDEAIEKVFDQFDPNNFDDSTNIDNGWLPLQPGRQWVYEGFTIEEGESIPHRIEFTVTDLSKEIEGVNTVVAWVEDYSDEELVEAEIAFYAQDNNGNVWYLGEYPEEYEEGEFVAAPTWIAGQEDAKAGIKMKAGPRLGTPAYFQGWGPAVDWSDYGQVDQLSQQTCVRLNCYDDVLVIAESSLEEPDAFQLKYYAHGVGNVRVGWRGEDATQEELELVELTQLDPEVLAEVRRKALELEEHAYEVSEDVYAHTTPAEHTLVAKVPVVTISESVEKVFDDFDPTNFDRSTNIDNEWLPLKPGTQWVYEGATTEDGETLPHRIEFTVTDLTKEIAGVETVVAWVLDYSDGELVEKEIAFYAQDNDGNVWYLGEYPAEYEAGKFVAAPTWIAGQGDSKAGIKMKTEPQLGTPAYFQGWGPGVDWTDFGQVDQLGQQTCVPVDCYEGVLVVAESSLGEIGAFQLKFYARGVGNVRVGWRGADATQEELELVELVQLSPEAMAAVRAEVLTLEEQAYQVSQDVYVHTLPAESP
jgi:uncharacterized protein YbaA (DUF1428 family)